MTTHILQHIADCKRIELDAEKLLMPRLHGDPGLWPEVPSMAEALINSDTGIIAEFKRRSPSRGEIHPMAQVSDIVPAYERNGAAACSVLTDTPFFGGSLSDLMAASSLVSIPLLRKEFIIDERQLVWARMAGASAVLLIAALLTREQIDTFTYKAHELGLEVLLELHSMTELDKYCEHTDMVGINNRDLTTFHTDPTLSIRMAAELPSGVVKIAESGLTSIEEVKRLRDLGYEGFLIGETFMKHRNPGEALKNFLNGTL